MEEVYEDVLDATSPSRMPIKAVKEQRLNAVDAGFGGVERSDSLEHVPPAKAAQGFRDPEHRDQAAEVVEEARHHEDDGKEKGGCCVLQ